MKNRKMRFTESQYRSFPASKKGRVTHEYAPDDLLDRFLGARTLIMGGRLLVEHISFEIVPD